MITKRTLFPVLFLIAVFSLPAFQWPVDQVVLKQTFGEADEGAFNTGLTLGGGRQEVKPISDGEVLYYYRDEQGPGAIPSGLGNFVVLEHERSLFSVYSHLEPDSPVLEGTRSLTGVTGDSVIGYVGLSGDAPGRELNLEIVDLEFNQMVNPLKLLPPLKDTTRPVVEGVFFRQRGEWEPLAEGMSLAAGEKELFISAYDQSESVPYLRPMAPFRISVFANGEEIFYQTFEAVESRDRELYLVSRQDLRSFRELYADDRHIRIGILKLNPGETILEIIVTDYRGNRSLRNLKFRVLPES